MKNESKNMNHMKQTVFLILFLAATLWSSRAADYRFERDIYYRPAALDAYADTMCRLDVAYPEGATGAPVVVWFHGGGLTGGHREVPEEFQRDGLIVVGVEYRLSPHVKTTEIIDDAAAAVAWTMSHIERYGGDTEQVFIAGHSAGGYLVNMIGLDKSWLAKYGVDPDRLAGMIPFSGQVITHFETRRAQGIQPLQPTIDQTAPLFHVRKDCPPILILSGDREKEMYGRYEETAYFWRMLKLVGHPDATIYEFDGFNHVTMLLPGFAVAAEFIKKHRK